LAPHSRAAISKEGNLTVWVDSPTLAFEINQRYKDTLFKRAQASLGEEEVKKIYIRVGQLR